MNDKQKTQIDDDTSETGEQHAPLTVQESGSIQEQNRPKTQQDNKPAEYELDMWERKSFRFKAIGIGSLMLILIAITFTGKIDKPAEFIVGSFLAVFVALIALNQYHVSKRQWFAMQEGLKKSQDMLDHNERVFRDAQRKEPSDRRKTMAIIEAAQSQAQSAKDGLKLAEESYFEAQKAYVSVRRIELQQINATQIILTTTLYNAGNTPAWDVEPKFRFCLGRFPIKETETAIPPTHPEQILHELAAHTTAIIRGAAIDLSSNEMKDILAKEKVLIISAFLGFRCIRNRNEEIVSHHLYDPHNEVFIYRKTWPTAFRIEWGGEWLENQETQNQNDPDEDG